MGDDRVTPTAGRRSRDRSTCFSCFVHPDGSSRAERGASACATSPKRTRTPRRTVVNRRLESPRTRSLVPYTGRSGTLPSPTPTLSLTHVHLPKLADVGFIEWDRESGDLSKGPNWEEIAPLLRLMWDHQDELSDGWLSGSSLGDWRTPDVRDRLAGRTNGRVRPVAVYCRSRAQTHPSL